MPRPQKTVRLKSKPVSIKTFNSLLVRAQDQIKKVNRSTVSKVYGQMPRYIKVVSFSTKMPTGKRWKLVLSYTLSTDDAFTYRIEGLCISVSMQKGRETKSNTIREWEGVGKAIGS